MCGINGIISYEQSLDEIQKALKKMNSLIFHRGPDDSGYFSTSFRAVQVGMAMQRLSIIDLNTGKQPIQNESGSMIIVFNGEIYNYRELKSYLVSQGIKFNTHSDTEVILKLYEIEGVDSFQKLDGMYAFSIFDKTKNKLIIARDLFGEKPLYYCHSQDTFLWASELKSLVSQLNYKPEISERALNLFLRLTYIPAPFTIYKNIFKLLPNHYLEFDLGTNSFKEFEINKLKSEYDTIDFNSAKNEVRNLVLESIESRSIADVPLGTFLSGGVDSSIVSLGLSKIKQEKIETFSIGFEKASFDETNKSRTVAKLIGSNHHEFILNEKDVENSLEEIILNFDEPFADSSALPTYLVSKKTRDYVKVALTGDGGDEVFGGYNKYFIGKINTKYTQWVPQKIHSTFSKTITPFLDDKEDNRTTKHKLKKLVNAISYDQDFYYKIISLGYQNPQEYIQQSYYDVNPFEYYNNILIHKPSSLSDFREIDRHLSLEGDMLVKVDRTSMLNSLECRAPFLNKKLWEYTNSLPEEFLIKKWDKKHILKEAFNEDFPSDFLNQPKQGFVVPVGDWLRSSLEGELKSFLDYKFIKDQAIFNSDSILNLCHNHLNGKIDYSYMVWTYYVFQKWYKNIYC